MSFVNHRKVLPQIMTTIAATICRIPNARISIPAMLGVSARTVENWLSGATQPTAMNLIQLMRDFDVVADEVLRLANKSERGLTFEQKRKLLEVLGE